MYRIPLVLSFVLLVLIVGCASNAAPTPTVEPYVAPLYDPTADSESAVVDTIPLAAWQTIALTDVRTGNTFTFADFVGQTVYVQPMATWCANCRVSQRNLQGAVMPEVADENVIFISLDVQTALSDTDLLTYTENEGFDWRFAVATPELMTALVAQFGLSIGNPPSQPHFIIRPNGTATTLMLGNPSPEEALATIRAESL